MPPEVKHFRKVHPEITKKIKTEDSEFYYLPKSIHIYYALKRTIDGL
jgi:hypothetical protein